MEGKGKGRSYLLKYEGLEELFWRLKENYRLIAPKLKGGVILYSEVESLGELPFGYRNVEMPGFYRLDRAEGFFTYTHPVNSLKAFLHPSELTLMKVKISDGGLEFEVCYPEGNFCFFDVRACDLFALEVLDRVFVHKNSHPDSYYRKLREGAFVVAVNCTYATSNCFCTTTGTGPEAREGYDLLITELREGFLLEAGSERGGVLLESLENKREAREEHLLQKRERLREAEALMERHFEIEGLPDRLYGRMDSQHWKHIEKRCLACTSCTQSCPTCFCFDILEKNNLELRESERVRVWDSCFSPAFATVHRYNIRQSVHSRYRQWLMHKFAYWVDQFDLSGCVGCGRCITWCPVGIDIRQEVKTVIREG
ncbi:MAG: 4Fe-4S dicluster domain-containing protein [Aquificaceae bacterium]|nr:4Fe-4S dicluster domain-containing protein [Aquificaceae bacterium]MDW8294646.1 4Fe-4S dicluster domain-containing protein [Aquificaceae bacterium]